MLYAGGVPNSKPAPADYIEQIVNNNRVSKVTVPVIVPFFPVTTPDHGAAVIICPGGGYSGLEFNHEGVEVARRFSALGITAFVLKYRLPSDSIMKDKAIGPLRDAQRAIQMIREHAAEWHLDTAKIGVMGFSAGGRYLFAAKCIH
jgi:acetyl esterase/lipase